MGKSTGGGRIPTLDLHVVDCLTSRSRKQKGSSITGCITRLNSSYRPVQEIHCSSRGITGNVSCQITQLKQALLNSCERIATQKLIIAMSAPRLREIQSAAISLASVPSSASPCHQLARFDNKQLTTLLVSVPHCWQRNQTPGSQTESIHETPTFANCTSSVP